MLIAAVPLLWPGVPPLTDLPGHIGRYRVMLGDEAALLDRYYAFKWHWGGNLGVDLLVAALGPVLGLEPAVKLVVILIPVLTTGALLWLSRELTGRVSPWVLFALPLAYSYPLHFGFVNYCLAMALALGGWALWLRMGRHGQQRLRAVVFVPIGLIIWTCHAMGWGMLGLFVFAGEWAQARDKGRGWIASAWDAGIAALPLTPPIAAMLLWRADGPPAPSGRFFEVGGKFNAIVGILRDRWMTFDLISMFLVLIAIGTGLWRRSGRMARPALAAVVITSATFVLMPAVLLASAYADMRIAPFIFAIALAGITPSSSSIARAAAIAGLAFFLLRTATTTTSFALYDADWQRQLVALDHLPRGARVLAIVGSPCRQPWGPHRRVHLPGLAIARNASFANDQWRMEAGALLSVKPDLGYYAYDPSQIIVMGRCHYGRGRNRIDSVLANFPRAFFTHVWVIDTPTTAQQRNGLSPVWEAQASGLYAVKRSASPLPGDAAAQ